MISYRSHLTGTFWLMLLASLLLVAVPICAQEDGAIPDSCSNGTDDDGDTLIDCDDPDCDTDAACLDCWLETQQLFGTTTSISDEFGYSVDVSEGVMIVGARLDDIPVSNSGSATIFTQEATTGVWQLTQTLTPPGSCCSSDHFGSGVGISGNTAAVGAQNFGPSSSVRYGAVFIYERDPATDQWLEVQTLLPSPLPSSSLADADFGAAIGLYGDWLVVGAPGYDTSSAPTGINRGSVYLFERDPETGSWQQRQQIIFSLSANWPGGENFGQHVKMSGDAFVVGASRYDASAAGSTEGTASIYERDPQSNVWAESKQLSHPDHAPGDQFGFSVALSGNVVVVGSWLDGDLGPNSGSAFVYERDPQSGVWQQTQQLLASTGAEGDRFGTSVAVSGDVIIVGAYLDDDQGSNSGSAFVYHRDNQTGLWTEQQQLLPASGGVNDNFGNAMSASGDVLVVGASLDDAAGQDAGGAFVFSLDEDCLVGGCGASNVEIDCLSYSGSNTHAVTMDVENRTPYEVDAIFIPLTVPGSTATISPNVIPLDSPLLSGESIAIELFMDDATGGQAVSFTVALMTTEATTGNLFECCSIQVDVTPPGCEYCLVITDEIFVWNGADVDYSFTVSNVSGDPLLLAEHVVLASYTPGVTLSNQWFTPVGGLADGESTSFSTVIQNATSNQAVCLQFSIHDALLGECCGFLRCLSLPAPLIPDDPLMVRGDANSDGTFNIADAVMTLNFLFQGTSTPCLDALDSNDDESVNVADVIFSLAALFGGSSFPAPPFPECGLDPTEGPLGCVSFPACAGSGPNGG